MKTICVVTSTRADYGLLSPVLFKLNKDSELNLHLVVTGSHLSKKYGMTIQEIYGERIPIHECISILPEDDFTNVSQIMANALVSFAEYFSKNRPDLVLVLGDRYEIFAVCCAAVNNLIRIAHIHGGETTEGAIDECYRHSITKMSYLHFTSCEAYRRRIIQLGEDPHRVFNVGALGIENVLNIPYLNKDKLSKELGFNLNLPYVVVTYHPVTLEYHTARQHCKELFKALDLFPCLGVLITKSNADADGVIINDMIDEYCKCRPNCKAFFSLGAQRYLTTVKYSKAVIGNSSSGILEVPALGVPTVNIGDRQKGRVKPPSVVDCLPMVESISDAIRKVLGSGFRAMLSQGTNVYGSGDSSRKIVEILKHYLNVTHIDLKKRFYDLPFAEKT